MRDRYHSAVAKPMRVGCWLAAGALLVLVTGGFVAVYRIARSFDDVETDVTSDSSQRRGIEPEGLYRIPAESYVQRMEGVLVLRPPAIHADPPSPTQGPSRAEYELNPLLWPTIIGFPSSEATFKVDRIHRYDSLEFSNLILIGRVTIADHVYDNVQWTIWRPDELQRVQ